MPDLECILKFKDDKLQLDPINESFLVINKNFEVIFLNQRAREKYAYNGPLPIPCYLLTHNLEHPCFEEQEVCPLRELSAGKGPGEYIHRHLIPGHQRVVYEKIIAFPLYGSSGNLEGIVEICTDITPLVEQEARTRAKLEAFIEVLEFPRVGVLLLDAQHRIAWMNRALEEFWGLERKEILSCNYQEIAERKLRSKIENFSAWLSTILEAYREGKTIENLEYHILKDKNTRDRWVSMFSQPIPGGLYAHGRIEYHFDITRRKELQREFLQAQRFETIAQMIAGITHGFNNLLMAIRGFSELSLMKLEENHPIRKNLKHIIASCEKGEDIIRKLLTFTRKHPIESKEIELVSFIKELFPIIQMAVGTTIKIDSDFPSAPIIVQANESDLEQIILNLVINARDAMPKGGRLWIRIRPFQEKVALEIEDTGVGIPSEILPRIFEPFFTTKNIGSGLGLSVVYGLVKSLGGEIEVHSTPGKGTLFRIWLPILSRGA